MSKLEDKAIEALAWVIVLPLVVVSAIGGVFLWLGAKMGLIKK